MKQIARAAPDNVQVQLQLAGLYAADERPGKAIDIYDSVLAEEGESFEAFRGRGDARLSLGEHAEAIADYLRDTRSLKVGVVNMTMYRPFPGDLVGHDIYPVLCAADHEQNVFTVGHNPQACTNNPLSVSSAYSLSIMNSMYFSHLSFHTPESRNSL